MYKIPGSRKGYYQWDMNQRLYIQDGNCNEVHFCSEKHPEALTCLVQEELGKRFVLVPNILLQSCLPITAFYYVKGSDNAYTKRSFSIEVWERPKPDDYVYTETEVKTWESAVEFALQEARESGAFKGDKGDKGDTGERGPQGEKGDKGDGFLTELDKIELSICCSVEGQMLKIGDAAELPFAGLRLYGKTVQAGMESAGNDSIGVKVFGKNLLNLPPHTTRRTHEIYFSALDGGVRMVGTSTAGYAQNNRGDHDALNVPAGTYTLKMEVSGTTNGATFGVMLTKNNANATSAEGKTTGSKTITIEDGNSYGCFVYMVESGKTVDCVVKAILVPGEEAAEWEPYISPQTVIVPNSLPGIPVTNGGNYTDAEGQMWLAHIAGYEQDGQVGELVTTGYIESYAGETIPGAYISSTGGLDAGASVRYALETPVFVAYDAQLQEQWKTLHTNKPNTTVYNDAGAWMQASYAADTKTYIDNKFTDLAAVILNNT